MPPARLAIFTTHPIQYQAPWFRALAAEPDLDVDVVFSTIPDAAQQGVGFGAAFAWDIPLRDGYRSSVLSSKPLSSRAPAFARRRAVGLGESLARLKPDAALICGWQDLSLAQALFACRRRGVPVIMRGESNALRGRPAWVRMLHRAYLSQCAAFLAIGKANADFYRGAGAPEARIVTAGYFVDNERFRASAEGLRGEREALRAAWAIPPDARCFAFVGKLEAKKRVLDFLGGLALARADGREAHALIVGSGEEMQAARAFAQERCLPVSFAGFLNQSEICRAYVAADAIVLPSDYGETWGLVVNEAMATGLPAIVSERIGSANDLVVNEETGLVVPFADRAALSRAIGRLCDERARRAMGEAAQRRVFADYSIDRAVEATREAVALVRSARPHARA